MSDEDAFSATVEVTRGTDTDDRDKIRVKVTAPSVDELDRRVSDLRERIESWADDLRTVQPKAGRSTSDDQQDLASVEA